MTGLKIVFMGTPEFAVPSLGILLNHGYQIASVITSPDKPRGRGQQLTYSAVKLFALKKNLPILQPVNLKDVEFQRELKSLSPDLLIVVAFRMLPETIWKMPVLGTINLHASLLPQYRGAAPINWAIINGESITGLTTFFIDQEIDTGKILLQENENILPEDDAGSLHDRLMIKGANLILNTVRLIESGNIRPLSQLYSHEYKRAPKISKEMCKIDFLKSAIVIHDFIRGLSPIPGAWTLINSRKIKIFKTVVEEGILNITPGMYSTDLKSYIKYQTGTGILNIVEFQVEGKKRMSVVEFFRGNKL